jgi:hypothetical protein
MEDDSITEINIHYPRLCKRKLRFPDVAGVTGEELNGCEGSTVVIPYAGNVM